ncbi:unnamed protein product [Pylaiella littoralis]
MSPAFVGAVKSEECINPATLYGSNGGGGGYSGSIGVGSSLIIPQGVTSAGRYHITDKAMIQAADDIAQFIRLAGDELHDVLLSRLPEVWGTVEAEMNAASDSNAAGDASTPPSSSHSQQQQPPRKNFHEALVERLKATSKAAKAEIEAAKARGEATALWTGRPQQWRGNAALRSDVLARLRSFKRNDQGTCDNPGGSGNGRFTGMLYLDQIERFAVGGGSGSGHCNIAPPADNNGGGGGLDHGLEAASKDARGEVKPELLPFGGDGNGRPIAVARHGLSTSEPAVQDRRPLAAAAAAAVVGGQTAPASTGVKRKKSGGGGAAAAATAGGSKKRKRSGNGRRCKHEGCVLHPHFGLTRPEYCSKHKLPGMFNVKGRRCVHQDCTRTPVYGQSGDPHPTYCAAHKPAGYVDIKNPTCREPTCFRQPSFGTASDRKATYCASHMLNGMVNVRRMLASFKSASLSAEGAGAAAGESGATGATGAGTGTGTTPASAGAARRL